MKKVYITLVSIALLISCGKKPETTVSLETLIQQKDVKGIQAKKEVVLKSYDSISAVLATIEVALNDFNPTKQLPVITVFEVKETVFNHYVDLQGDVATKQNIIIFPEYSGLLSKVYVTEGQRVEKGQLLAVIADGGLRQQLAQLEVQAAFAKTTYERQQRLWKQKIGSEINYLQAEATYKSQKNAVEQLKVQLEKTKVTAPFSGVIDDVISEQGQIVAPGQSQLFRIVNLNNMYVKASVPESYLATIKKGTFVKLQFTSLGKNIEGTVRQVSNVINPNNRTFSIEISIPNTDRMIKPNLIANLEILDYSNKKALLIPSDVIQENAQGAKFVYVVQPTKNKEVSVVKTAIKTGVSYRNKIEVIQGLTANTIIVKEGAITMRNGLTVKIKD